MGPHEIKKISSPRVGMPCIDMKIITAYVSILTSDPLWPYTSGSPVAILGTMANPWKGYQLWANISQMDNVAWSIEYILG